MSKEVIFSVCAATLVISWLIGAYALGRIHEKTAQQLAAIKRGHAYWHVNEDGSTEFRWKETTK